MKKIRQLKRGDQQISSGEFNRSFAELERQYRTRMDSGALSRGPSGDMLIPEFEAIALVKFQQWPGDDTAYPAAGDGAVKFPAVILRGAAHHEEVSDQKIDDTVVLDAVMVYNISESYIASGSRGFAFLFNEQWYTLRSLHASCCLVKVSTSSGSYNTSAGELVVVDASSVNNTSNLPASPNDNDEVMVLVGAIGTGKKVTVGRNGKTIRGGCWQPKMIHLGEFYHFRWCATDSTWLIVNKNVVPFDAQMRLDSGQSMSNGIEDQIEFDVVQFDITGGVALPGSNARMVVPRSSIIEIEAGWRPGANVASTQTLAVATYYDSVAADKRISAEVDKSSNSSHQYSIETSRQRMVDEGDEIFAGAFQNTGAGLASSTVMGYEPHLTIKECVDMPSIEEQLLGPELAAYYRMQETGVNDRVDQVADLGVDLRAAGTVTTGTGKVSANSARFDGADENLQDWDAILLGNATKLAPADHTLSTAFWWKVTDISNHGTSYSGSVATVDPHAAGRFILQHKKNGSNFDVRFRVSDKVSNVDCEITGLLINTWYFITMIADRYAELASLIIRESTNILSDTAALTLDWSPPQVGDTPTGAYGPLAQGGGSGQHAKCEIEQWGIWALAMNEAQQKYLFNDDSGRQLL